MFNNDLIRQAVLLLSDRTSSSSRLIFEDYSYHQDSMAEPSRNRLDAEFCAVGRHVFSIPTGDYRNYSKCRTYAATHVGRTSIAASMAVSGFNKAKLIHDFLNNRI